MALSRVLYAGDGATVNFTIPFSFISKSYIEVYLDGVLKTYTTDYTITGSVLTFGAAPGLDVVVLIKRVTDSSARLVDFEGASSLTEADLDLSAQQVFDIAQEAQDSTNDTVKADELGNFDALGNRIVNVGDPVNDGDAVNKAALEAYADSFDAELASATAAASSASTSATNASSSASAAAASASAASTSETNASASASAAAASAAASATSETNAASSQASATASASAAATSASSASTSATNSAASASSASTSATNSSASASSASTSATNASTAADDAAASAAAAAVSEANAASSAVDAENWANAVNLPDPTGQTNKALFSDGTTNVYKSASEILAILGTASVKAFTATDIKAAATDGGSFTSGAWRDRDLNTLNQSPSGTVSLSSNTVTIPAGKWIIQWSAPAIRVNSHQSRLIINESGTPSYVYGDAPYTAAGSVVQNFSRGMTIINSSSSFTIKIQHQCQTTRATDGFGGQGYDLTMFSQVLGIRIGDAS